MQFIWKKPTCFCCFYATHGKPWFLSCFRDARKTLVFIAFPQRARNPSFYRVSATRAKPWFLSRFSNTCETLVFIAFPRCVRNPGCYRETLLPPSHFLLLPMKKEQKARKYYRHFPIFSYWIFGVFSIFYFFTIIKCRPILRDPTKKIFEHQMLQKRWFFTKKKPENGNADP